MTLLAPLLLALALILAPIVAALPDDTTSMQTFWASGLSVLVLAAALVAVIRAGQVPSPPRARTASLVAFAALLGLALLSLFGRLVSQHSTAYLGLMLRGWTVLAVQFAVFALCRDLARRGRGALYGVILAAVLGAAYVSAVGVNEYLLHVVAHQSTWRVFATSTPDFLAGYLVLMLPVTLALFLGAPPERRLPWLFGLIVVLQLATMLTTGSRFALVSLVVALAVFGGSAAYAVRRGMTLAPATRQRLIGIAVVVALAGLVVARPVLRRLHDSSQANSAAFRVWTWRGAAHMAAANPILGTGIGAWIDLYPNYALTGFTRLAHNSYLQMADECGLPALLALMATLGLAGVAASRGLTSLSPTTAALKVAKRKPRQAPVAAPPASNPLDAVAPADDRLLLCGLLGSLAAGVMQNLIDSDWYVFFIGVTFWALAGLAVGMATPAALEGEETDAPPPRARLILAGSAAVLFMALFVSQGIAALAGNSARQAADPSEAADGYATAQTWDPLNARYPGDLGYRVYAQQGKWPDAEASLRQAFALEPNGTNAKRLGTVLDAQNKPGEAATAYRAGLTVDPNSLDLRLALAKDSPTDQALNLYRQISTLEDSPVGKVRAIGEVTEVKFALADAALGSAALSAGSRADALRDNTRAAHLMESYADEGGTMNAERQALIGNRPDPAQDSRIRDLYAHVMADLTRLAPNNQQEALQSRAQDYALRFRTILAQDYTTLGDYERAAELLQSYADEGGTQSGQKQGLLQSRPDPKQDAQMRDLYKSVMDSLQRVSPPDQRPVLQAREQLYLQKFAALFPKP